VSADRQLSQHSRCLQLFARTIPSETAPAFARNSLEYKLLKIFNPIELKIRTRLGKNKNIKVPLSTFPKRELDEEELRTNRYIAGVGVEELVARRKTGLSPAETSESRAR
jgi:hypothetical protein